MVVFTAELYVHVVSQACDRESWALYRAPVQFPVFTLSCCCLRSRCTQNNIRACVDQPLQELFGTQ